MILDEESGEILDARFAKMYFKDIGKLFGLGGVGYSTLMLMARMVGLGHNSSINMSPARKREFAEKLGCTTRQINNQLKIMLEKDVIRKNEPEEYPNKMTINPEIIFSGNDFQRIRVLISYSGGSRKVRSFANQSELDKYLDATKGE